MSFPYIRVSERGDPEALAPNLREADRTEVEAFGITPFDALQMGLEDSDECYTIVEPDHGPICMFGINGSAPWLLASSRLLANKAYVREFLTHCRDVVADWYMRYGPLANIVHADNTVHIRWLQWSGFTLHRDKQSGPFIPFTYTGGAANVRTRQ